MKTQAIVMTAAILSAIACNAQQNKGANETQQNNAKGNQPKVSWKVNKQLDKNGNVIAYDSTYTWSYTDTSGAPVSVNVDSVMGAFNGYFNNNFPSLWGRNFPNPFPNDSTFSNDFFQPNYFQNLWQDNFFNMENMFRQMDSLHNQFFQQNFPGLQQMPGQQTPAQQQPPVRQTPVKPNPDKPDTKI